MITNEKPRTQGTGRINHLDGESITDNVTAINRLKPNPEFVFGKSSPIITARDIWLNDYLHDAHWYESKLKTDSDLRAQGLKSIWSLDDQLRAVEFESRKAIANLIGGDVA
jgi:hypothetical protein